MPRHISHTVRSVANVRIVLCVLGLLCSPAFLAVARAAEETPADVTSLQPAPLQPALLVEPAVRDGRVADQGFYSLCAGVYAAGLGDWVTTRQFRQDGVEEANPVMESMADSTLGLAAVKLGGGTLVNYIAYNLKKDGKRYWKVPQIVWIALNVVVVVHNTNARR